MATCYGGSEKTAGPMIPMSWWCLTTVIPPLSDPWILKVYFDDEGFRIVCMLELAEGSGEITLTTSDPAVQPFIDCRYLEHPRDRERLRDAVRISLDIIDHGSFVDIVERILSPTAEDLVSDETLDEWMMANVFIGQHLSGTCKMGPASDEKAVVDQFGQVHGIENLRVADASIMPDCIRANTNLTAIMIGERIADWIANGNQ